MGNSKVSMLASLLMNIVNGVPVVQNGELTTFDEAEAVRSANRVVRRYLNR